MRSFIGLLFLLLLLSCENKTASTNNQNTLHKALNVPSEADTTKALRDSLMQIDDEYPVNTTLHFKEFSVEILSYQVQNELSELAMISGDTIELSEWVGSNLMNRKINIKANNNDLRFKIDYRLNDIIYEQYDHRITYDEDKKWHKWEGFTPYRNIEIKNNVNFVFPDVDLASGYLKFRKKQLDLRDTFVDLSGESDNIATVVYKEKPSIYNVESVLIRIIIFDNNQQKGIKYLKVILSSGC